jgi:hypothetical protein
LFGVIQKGRPFYCPLILSLNLPEHLKVTTFLGASIIASTVAGFDIMSITRNPLICVWNILRYGLRIWNGKQKEHDIEKIAHYAELAWTMADGKVIKSDS